jgi:hypothetical protein
VAVQDSTKAVAAKEKTVEDLLARLDALQAQQAELDKAKTETVALLKEKLKQQRQRLRKLGVSVEEETVPSASTGTPWAPPSVDAGKPPLPDAKR